MSERTRAVLDTGVVTATDVEPLDGELAVSAAAVVAAGRQPRARTTDLPTAATAHAHGARLHTCNAADLRGVAAARRPAVAGGTRGPVTATDVRDPDAVERLTARDGRRTWRPA